MVILVLMVLLGLMAPQAKMESLDRGELEEILVQRVWLVLRAFLVPQVLLEHPVMLEREEKLAQEDLWVHLVLLEREA